MSRSEIINLLYDVHCRSDYSIEELADMLLSIEHLNPGEWIPVSERLPEEKINPLTKDFEYVSCTTVWGDVRPYRYGKPIHMKDAHFWHGWSAVDEYVVAWQPLPDPYRGPENE